MGNALFIIWRESAEAMLVVGILYAWLKGQPQAKEGMRYLWGGVAAGVGLALAIAAVMLGIASSLSPDALEYFQLGMVLVAAALIVQMVFWMRSHGRTLKKDLESGLKKNAETSNWWGMLTVVALAVGRESSETVVFLWGLGVENQNPLEFAGIVALGIALAYLTFWVLQQGGRLISWKLFFKVSEILLLLLAASMLMTGIEKMINFGWVPPLVDPVWDSSAVLDDSTRAGGLVASLTGYRAHPALVALLAYGAYWLGVLIMMHRKPR